MNNFNKSKKSLYLNCNIRTTEEYDVVTYQDILLMSDKSSVIKNDQNDAISNLFCKKNFSLYQFKEEWNELYDRNEFDFEVIRQKCMNGKLQGCYFRSLCWRCLLGILHKQPIQWLCQLQTYRKHYNEVCLELQHNPWNVNIDLSYDNPLSQESESIWQKYFCDEELKSVILQDVKRTFPDLEYFRNENIQKIMVRILFCYARQNPLLCYRQGMHEILAPLILVLHLDHQALHYAMQNNLDISEDIKEILCPEYLEHDAYSIFKNIMSQIQYSYNVNMKDDHKTDQNEVIERLEYIEKYIFQPKDPELSAHLYKLDIPMHLYGIRWLKLLFGREFQLKDLLVLWDFLFFNNLEYVNYVVVAMLVAIRQTLLKEDYNTCLCTLMKYPNGVNVNWIMAYVLHLKDPKKYSVPDIAQMTPVISKTENGTLFSSINKRLRGESFKQLKWFSTKQNFLKLKSNGDGDGFIVHEFVPNKSGYPEIELQQIKILLGVVNHKLLHYHSVLNKSIVNNVNLNSDVKLIVDDIYELSHLLKKFDVYEIETACEADEDKEFVSNSHLSNEFLEEVKPTNAINWENRSHTLPKIKKG